MAIQDGLIKLKGNMGDISFYKTKDGYAARKKGGLDAERVRTDPAFERTRENGAEFGRAGASGKLIRTAIRPLIKKAHDSRMTNRLTRQMMKVIRADATSPRGQRNATQGELEFLRGFEFNENGKLTETFYAPYSTEIDRETGLLSVDISEFVPDDLIRKPEGATHLKLVVAGIEVDFAAGTYGANVTQTEPIVIGPQEQGPLALSCEVTAATTLPLFLVFGVQFFQHVNGQYYALRNGAFNPLAIVDLNRSEG